MSLMTWLFGEHNLSEQKQNADESRAHLDSMIEETHRSAERAKEKVEQEAKKSQHVITMAERVLSSLHSLERRSHR